MKKWLLIMVNSFIITLLISGCKANLDGETSQTDQQTQPILTNESTPLSSEKVILTSKNDLAQRLNIDIAEINTVFLRLVTWSDTSLGCPQDGIEYAQVITEGYQILLEAKDYLYEYHTDKKDAIILCASAPSNQVNIPKKDASLEDSWPSQPISGGSVIITPRKN
jgi:hypothetical protein